MTPPDVPVLLVCGEPRRAVLSAAVRAAGGLRLAQAVTCPERAAAAAGQLGRGVLVLDAGVDGGPVALVRSVMSCAPLPILVLGDGLDRLDVEDLLAAGAVEVRGDSGTTGLSERCRVLVGVGVVCRPAGPRPAPLPRDGTVLAVGASTGGPPAVAALLRGLAGLPVPVLLVQHMAPDFVPALARWLADTCPLPVSVAVDGEPLRPGHVHLGPGGQHLHLLPGGRVGLLDEPSGLHVPSVDELFASVAGCRDVRGVGVLLTGMGRDGARGLLALREAGGRTLAQDEATSTVYGMPRAAVELGAAERVVPLPDLADAVLGLLAGVPG